MRQPGSFLRGVRGEDNWWARERHFDRSPADRRTHRMYRDWNGELGPYGPADEAHCQHGVISVWACARCERLAHLPSEPR